MDRNRFYGAPILYGGDVDDKAITMKHYTEDEVKEIARRCERGDPLTIEEVRAMAAHVMLRELDKSKSN